MGLAHTFSSKSILLLFLFLALLSLARGAQVLKAPYSFHSEYCGFNSWNSGINQVTCTFSAPQSDIIRHDICLSELSKPGNADISFKDTSSLSPVPSTSAIIRIENYAVATVKLGFFVIVIKNQLPTKYIDFVTMSVPISATNVSDSSNTIRFYAVDADIHTISIMTGMDLNNLKIVPFITSYSMYLGGSVINTPGSEINCMFVFNYQIVSPNILKLKVTLQPTVSMYQFRGSMLLVNIQQIMTQKAAFLSNPTLTATNCLDQKYVIGDTALGKLLSADYTILFGDFGTSFNTKCFLGFEKIKYTQLTQFSFQFGKNALGNFNSYSQTMPTLTGLIPEIGTVFFCYGLGKECSDLSLYSDLMDLNCYTPSSCPLPVPGAPGTWPHVNVCPWCQELICKTCTPTNRSQCSECHPGSNSFLNTVTKKCQCITGYYFAYTILNPVTWNGATTSAYNCILNCTYQYSGCQINQCDSTQCLQCLFDHMFVYPATGPRYCQKCSTIQSNCVTCTILYICDTCELGYYKVENRQLTSPFNLISSSCQPCLLNCKYCPDSSTCNTCFPGYELASGNTQCNCKSTLAGLLNCVTCTVNTTCTLCEVGYYISSATGKCEPCSYIHAECLTCSDQNTCSTCNVGYGTDSAVVLGKVVCSVCNKVVNYCDDCTSISNCLHCVAPYGFAAPLQCMYCELLKFPGCIECTIKTAPCTKCNSTSFLLNGTCYFCHIYYHLCISCQADFSLQTLECLTCQPGYYVGFNTTSNKQECLPCPKAMNKCLECSNSTYCTKCQFPNELGSTNQCTLCTFPYVNYNNGSCVKYAGCANVLETSPGVMICLACNETLNFIFEPGSNNCLCAHGYYETIAPQPTQKCQPICGDGILIMPDEECDDNNLIDYDGCSKNCKQEFYFDCNQASPSTCVLIRDFTKFQFAYAERISAENKGILYFMIEPKQIGLTHVNWSKFMILNFISNSVNSSFLSYSYQFDTGMVKVQFPYTETVENTLISYQLKFDPSYIKSSISMFRDVCQVKGANFPLIVENSIILEHGQYIQVIALVLSVLAMVQFYLGSYLGKMIGLQTIQIFQFVCFARFLVFTKNTTLLNALQDLKYSSSGYSNAEVLFGTQQVSSIQLISEDFNKIHIQKYYLLNINFWLIPIIFVALAYLVISVRKFFEWRTLMQGDDAGAKYKYVLTRRSVQYIYEQCIFPQVMMIGMLVYFNNLLCFQVDNVITQDSITPLEIQSLAFQTLSQYAIMAVFAFEMMASLKEFIRPRSEITHLLSLHEKYEIDQNSPHKPNYHVLYIFVYSMYYFLLYIIMSLDVMINSFVFALEITIGMNLVYFLLICFWSPYFKIVNIHNTFLKVNHGIALAVLAIYEVFNRNNSASPTTYVIMAYTILTLLFIVLIGGFLRIYYEHLYRKKLSFKISQGQTKLTLVEEDQIAKRMTKKEKTDKMLLNNRFTIKNQLSQLKKNYFANQGSLVQDQKLTKDQEAFFISKIKEEFQQKNHIYRDFWGNKTLDEPLVEQAPKPAQMENLVKVEPQNKNVQEAVQNQNGQKVAPKRSKAKHSVQEKEALQKLKRKLRSELIHMGE